MVAGIMGVGFTTKSIVTISKQPVAVNSTLAKMVCGEAPVLV